MLLKLVLEFRSSLDLRDSSRFETHRKTSTERRGKLMFGAVGLPCRGGSGSGCRGFRTHFVQWWLAALIQSRQNVTERWVSTKSDDYNCTLHNVTSPLKATNASNIWRNLRSKMKGVSVYSWKEVGRGLPVPLQFHFRSCDNILLAGCQIKLSANWIYSSNLDRPQSTLDVQWGFPDAAGQPITVVYFIKTGNFCKLVFKF